MNLYELKENRVMRPKTFSAMLSNLLYERRFGPYFIEPVIAGLDPIDNKPYVCNMDLVIILFNCSENNNLQMNNIIYLISKSVLYLQHLPKNKSIYIILS